MMQTTIRGMLALCVFCSLCGSAVADKPRARDLGIPFEGAPGQYNAITDVEGVLVGHTTLISGEGKLEVGKGPVRTGVTAILTTGRDATRGVIAARDMINGTGELTGTWLIDELGIFAGPIMLTGTSSVGIVHHATSKWIRDNFPPETWMASLIPVVGETLDSYLNDVWGYHVKEEHVYAALDSAAGGPVAEGNVGGGTGMIAYAFKGGIGTASRVFSVGEEQYTVGVLLQANHASRDILRIAGVPVGREIPDLMPTRKEPETTKSSLVIIIATDASLTPDQLGRVARRGAMGLGRTGSTANFMSGELVLAFTTANAGAFGDMSNTIEYPTAWNGEMLNKLFRSTAEAVEEALVNCLVAAETMTGRDGNTVFALPHDRLRAILKKYNRLLE